MDGDRVARGGCAGNLLHYQPIVDLRSDQIVGAEALLRWRHPTLGLLPPGQFLPVVESSGLMPEIGAWVLGAACRQMREWRKLAWQPFRLAVNVSASQWDRVSTGG
jgi:EAL domain-containing protein (putative c-di-GMP-specific phosphodiesterase class I)